MATLVYVGVAFVLLLYRLYKYLLPRPLPGIPYNEKSAKRFSGDKTDFIASYLKHGEGGTYRRDMCRELGFPLLQMLAPLSKPMLWLDDPREIEDIVLRRNKEFDRADVTIMLLQTVMPHSTIVTKTTPEFKAKRKLWQDVMAPEFLRNVVAPGLHRAGVELIQLWEAKTSRANGNEFDIRGDFDAAALDAIWAAILGEPLGGLQEKIQDVRGIKKAAVKQEDLESSDGAMMQKTLDMLNKNLISCKPIRMLPSPT